MKQARFQELYMKGRHRMIQGFYNIYDILAISRYITAVSSNLQREDHPANSVKNR